MSVKVKGWIRWKIFLHAGVEKGKILPKALLANISPFPTIVLTTEN